MINRLDFWQSLIRENKSNKNIRTAPTQQHTDTHLRGGKALLGQLAHVLGHLLGGDLEPRGRAPLVGEGRLGDTLTSAVHATHLLRS